MFQCAYLTLNKHTTRCGCVVDVPLLMWLYILLFSFPTMCRGNRVFCCLLLKVIRVGAIRTNGKFLIWEILQWFSLASAYRSLSVYESVKMPWFFTEILENTHFFPDWFYDDCENKLYVVFFIVEFSHCFLFFFFESLESAGNSSRISMSLFNRFKN